MWPLGLRVWPLGFRASVALWLRPHPYPPRTPPPLPALGPQLAPY